MGILLTQASNKNYGANKAFILQAPNMVKWQIEINDDGTASALSGVSGTVTDIKVTKPDFTEASFDITNNGELQVISPAVPSATLDDNFNLRNGNNVIWKITVNNNNTLVTEQ